MLSILIPIYNQKVTKLVTDLHAQCNKSKTVFEIILFDDYSKEAYREDNRKLAGLFNVSYLEMSENYGRSKIRNLLAKNARYEKLLFLDCDSKLHSKKFIKKYVAEIDKHQVIYGGRIYPNTIPKSQKKILHWKYGKKRESVIAKKRKNHPYLSFQSNNFIINTRLFLSHKFDDSLKQYGHEDLVLATQLKTAKIIIHHLDNPIKHAGIEKTEAFLNKQKAAIDNLITLRSSGKIMYTKLWKAYDMLKRRKALSVFIKLYPWIERKVETSLYSDKPSMYALDLWKLNYLVNSIK